MATMSFEDREKMIEEMHKRIADQNDKDNEISEERERDEKGRFISNKEDEQLESEENNNNEELQSEEKDKENNDLDDFLSYEDLKSKKVKAKINGEDVLVDAEELIKHYQKERSADQKFQEAAKIQKELAEEKRNLIELQQKLIEQQQKNIDSAKEVKSNLPEKDDEKELIEALLMGDEDKSVEQLKTVVSKLSANEVNRRLQEELDKRTTELESKAYSKAMEALTIRNWEESLQTFSQKRKDILEDEFLVQIFDSNLGKLVENYGYNPKVIDEAERMFDTWAETKGIKTSKTEQKVEENEATEKINERKEKIDKVKKYATVSSATATSQSKKEEAPKEGSDLVLEMKRIRQPWLFMDKK